jgi:hypothetical protein
MWGCSYCLGESRERQFWFWERMGDQLRTPIFKCDRSGPGCCGAAVGMFVTVLDGCWLGEFAEALGKELF